MNPARMSSALKLPALLALVCLCAGTSTKERHRYEIRLAREAGGGPLKAAPEGGVAVPEELAATSSPKLDEKQQAMIAWHYRNAARLAQAFAEKENTRVYRDCLPASLQLYLDPSGVAHATGQPRYEGGGEAVGRIDLRNGVVYLGSANPKVLYAELGKWFFYEPNYHWGQNRTEDRKRMYLAMRFARYCLDQKNWSEDGGSAGALW